MFFYQILMIRLVFEKSRQVHFFFYQTWAVGGLCVSLNRLAFLLFALPYNNLFAVRCRSWVIFTDKMNCLPFVTD